MIHRLHDLQIDIAIITETKLISTDHVKVTGYDCLRRDRTEQGRGGRVMLLIKKGIILEPMRDQEYPYSADMMEVQGIKVKVNNTNEICILVVYRKPDGRPTTES